MFLLSVLIFTLSGLQFSEQYGSFVNNAHQSEAELCASGQRCAFLEYCPALLNLMNQQMLPVYRLRQAICGYQGTNLKVCCDTHTNSINPIYTDQDNSNVKNSNPGFQCGSTPTWSRTDDAGAFPFVARIGFMSDRGELKYPCNGVVLNERSILTSASCALATSNNYKLYSVLVGASNTQRNPGCDPVCGYDAQCYNISCVIKHPDYRPDVFSNNIAILQLDKPIQFSATAQPICLPPKGRYINVGSFGTLVGYGKLSNQRNFRFVSQQSLPMKMLSVPDCQSYREQGFAVELCAIGNEMPCAGYSGSPLVSKVGQTSYLVGILSYGSNCDPRTNFPTVFVDVQKYSRWIVENCSGY